MGEPPRKAEGSSAQEPEDVYSKVVYSKPSGRGHDEERVQMMGFTDPAERYQTGSMASKDVSRYSTTLRNMIPVRPGKGNARGGARIDEAGLFSFVTYSWIFSYLWSAFRGQLDRQQVWNCSIYDASNVNMSRLEVLWEQELKLNPTRPSLARVVFRFIKTRLLAACAVFLFCLIFGFIGPTCFIRGLIAFTEKPPLNEDGSIYYKYGLILVLAISIVEIARVLSYGATWAVSYRTGIRVRGALLGLLFKKISNAKNLEDTTSAEIINIYANDGQRLFDAVTFAPLVLMGPLVLIGGIVYLLCVIGPWSLLGVAVFFLFDVIQYCLGMTMMHFRQETIKKTEERISLMGEIVKCIRLIKMNAWEEAFQKRVNALRHSEKVSLRTAGYAQSLAIACGPVVPVVAAILTFLGIILSGNDLLASDAFSSITVFYVMVFGVRMIPYGGRYMGEAIVAIWRIEYLILLEHWESQLPLTNDPQAAVEFENYSCAWTGKPREMKKRKERRGCCKRPTPQERAEEEAALLAAKKAKEPKSVLHELKLTIKKKELVGVCGSVGSGKSALLNSVLGHMHSQHGEVLVSGSVAYVPQTAWIQSATIQENILFGSLMHSQRYYKAVQASQLTKDLEVMTSGDQTEVGERGTTLSGGQKARLSLARALFSNKDIYLLDDIFASLDSKVADKIFDEAVCELLAQKTVLLVTNNPQILQRCDSVIFLEAGRLISYAPHEELMMENELYRAFVEASRQTESDSGLDSLDKTLSLTSTGEAAPAEEADIVAPAALAGNQPNIEKTHRDKLVDDEEDLGLAKLAFSVYTDYIRAAGSWPVWLLFVVAFVFNVSASIFSTFWLSRWLKRGHQEEFVEMNGTTQLHSPGSLANSPDTGHYATIYGISLFFLFISGLFKACIFVKFSLNACSRLHNWMFSSVIKGAVAFFDSTPSGRILNRFSKDIDEIDVKMPFTAEMFLQNMLTCVGFMLIIAYVFPVFLLFCVPLIALFALFLVCFRAGIRSLKRSENISRSPLYDHITATLEGLPCIHSYGQTARFIETLKHRLDANTGAIFMFQSAMRWLAVWLDLLVVAVTCIVALLMVILTGSISPADAGMAIAFAVQMSGIFQYAVRTQTELEAKMTSVERVSYYAKNISAEGDWETKRGIDVPPNWPTKGQINFQDVKLRYRPSLPLALNEVSFEIAAGEKIGVIGRTGSGKSSLGNVLYRLYPLTWGKIFIDGVDIATIGLHTLRKVMAIVPQDPMLFRGTLRFNLDPNNQFTDSQLWEALERTYLKDTIASLPKKLETPVTSGGENFSVGERQLLCLARALLIKSKIVLLDEATASLDIATDRLIQKVISEVFTESTVIMIAHRLENVRGMDRVMLLDGGKLIDFDRPLVILSRTPQQLRHISDERKAEPSMNNSAIEASPSMNEDDVIMVAEASKAGESSPEIVSNRAESPEIVPRRGSSESVELMGGTNDKDAESSDDSSAEMVNHP